MLRRKIMYIFLFLIIMMIFGLQVFAEDSKQELVAAFGQDIVTFDMHNYRGSQDIIAGNLVYETLVSTDKEDNTIPKLAASWEQIDSLTWKFYLRDDVKFHDGTPFNADVVKFSIKRCAEGGGGSYAGFVKEVEIVDDYTVLLHLNNEFGNVLGNLSEPIVGMMNPKFVEEKGADITQFANGTGPFILEEYIPGTGAVFVKNEEYWGEPAKLDKVEFRTIPEEGTRIMALRSGEVDIIENPPPHELASIEKDKNLYVYVSPKNRTLFVSFNFEDENVGGEENRALREAIAYAINPQEIVDYVLEGLALPLDKGFIPESISRGANDLSLVRKPDLEKAKQILKEAGIEPGRKVEFWVTRGRYLLDTATGEVIQEQLSKAGIDAEVVVMEMGPMINAMSKHEQEMYQIAWGWATGDAHQVFHQLFNSESRWNLSAYKNEKFDQINEKASITVDWNERMALYNSAYKILFDDVVLVPILQYKNIYAANKKVKGFFANPIELALFNEVYIEE